MTNHQVPMTGYQRRVFPTKEHSAKKDMKVVRRCHVLACYQHYERRVYSVKTPMFAVTIPAKAMRASVPSNWRVTFLVG
jgi:hypothetical protein